MYIESCMNIQNLKSIAGMVLQGIQSQNACSNLTTSRLCGHIGGHAYSVFCFEVVTGMAHSVSKCTYLYSAY